MCVRVRVGQSAVVGAAGGDRAAVQLFQVRQRLTHNVSGVVHPPAATQSRPLLQLAS